MTTLKSYVISLLMLVALLPASAQKIQTLDKDGQPVPYVSIMTPDARFIGITDLNGIIDDVNGADTISVSHIAYKPKLYKVNGKSGHITLEDADFGLPEITVTKKPLVYVQTYYRMYIYSEERGIIYFRCGITDNSYDRKTKKLKADTNHGSKAIMGIIKTLVNSMIGGTLDRHSHIRMKKIEDNIKKNYPHLNIKFTQDGPNRKHISDDKGTLGYVTDNQSTGLRRYTFDTGKAYEHELEASGNTKKLAKREKRKNKAKNTTKAETNYRVYRIDENGNYAPEDFVLYQMTESYDHEVEDGKTDHRILAFEVFTTDRAYVTKDELKQLKKESKIKINYKNVMQFERQHKVPPMSDAVQKRLNELWKADKDD